MTNLTPEQIADGWKPIADIVNEPDDGIVQTASIRNKVFWIEGVEPCFFIKRSELNEKFPNNAPFYRRLIPQTPDMVVISREDAEFIIREMRFRNGSLTENQELYWDNLQAKLEGK